MRREKRWRRAKEVSGRSRRNGVDAHKEEVGDGQRCETLGASRKEPDSHASDEFRVVGLGEGSPHGAKEEEDEGDDVDGTFANLGDERRPEEHACTLPEGTAIGEEVSSVKF
jgi:hypothetical protein